MFKILFLACIAGLLTIGVTLLKKERSEIRNALLSINLIVFLWLLFDTLPHFIINEKLALIFAIHKIVIIIFTPIFFYRFALVYTGYSKFKSKRNLLLTIIPLISLLSLATNFPFRYFESRSILYDFNTPIFIYYPTVGFYIHTTYSYILFVVSMGIIYNRSLSLPKEYRRSINIMVSVSLFSLLANIVVLNLHIVSHLFKTVTVDITSVFISIKVLIMYRTVYYSAIKHKDILDHNELKKGLKNEEFVLYLQPQVDITTSKSNVIGAEALIRWVRDGKIYKNPDQFISSAEKNGMIIPLGNWIIDEIFRINRVINRKKNPLKLSINVSIKQLMDKKFIEKLENSILENSDMPIDLVIEITESVMVKDTTEAIKQLNRIRDLGIGIALDDFGTGYSSLSYIKELPLDILKIDKSFIDDIVYNSINLTPHILNIASTLNFKTVCEGVENFEQSELLTKYNCDIIQGYYYSKPLEFEEFKKFIS